MINYTLLKQLITTRPHMTVGETLRFDHAGCPAGEDTRGRLYVKRTSDNFWVAYCHNCGSPGWYKEHLRVGFPFEGHDNLVDQLKKLLNKDELPPVPEHEIEEPEESVFLGSLLSTKVADDWMIQRLCAAGFSSTAIDERILWYVDCNNNTLVTPLWYRGKVIGKQERLPPGFKPKTITTYTNGAPKVGYDALQDASPFGKDTMVITEDPLSALCIHHACINSTGYALLGTHLSDVKRNHVMELIEARDVKQIAVWLDPDEAGRKGTWEVVEGLRHALSLRVGIKIVPQSTPEPAKMGDFASIVTTVFNTVIVKKGT